ncbi:hypothetical protein F2S73_01045 [Pseudomonas syringae pv. actinidiae]|nr:hypothetical protein [Pseudomonas syringae pv. actinidiae]
MGGAFIDSAVSPSGMTAMTPPSATNVSTAAIKSEAVFFLEGERGCLVFMVYPFLNMVMHMAYSKE